MNKLNVLSKINSQMAAVLEKQNELSDSAYSTDVDLATMRENYERERKFWNEGGATMFRSRDLSTDGPCGAISLRMHYPTAAEVLPAIIYIHGGGFILGNLETHDRIMRCLAALTGAVVVGVDYRLSPEAKFPSATKECVHVAEFLRDDAQAYGIDPGNIAFAGDSGGALLALSTYLYLRDEKKNAGFVKALLLYYGMYGLWDSKSRRLLGGPWDGLAEADLRYYFECFCDDFERVRDNPYLNCLTADLTRDVAPCYIAAATLDPLIDDSLALAAMLAEAGVPHKLEIFDGVLHAFLHHSRMLDEARAALVAGAAFYREQTGFCGEIVSFDW